LKRTAEVVVIGAGIQGTSVAYHLARRGMTDVVVVEMGTIGSGSSGRSAAMLVHHTFSRTHWDLLRISLAAYRRFEEELEVDPGLRSIGRLRLVTHRLATETPYTEPRAGYGSTCEVLDTSQIDALVPGLFLEDVAFGLYNPEDAVLDPHAVYRGYASWARRQGVEICEGVKAICVQIRSGQVVGVVTSDGVISAPRLVNAAGPWAREVGTWAGLDLPIANFKRHIFFVTPPPPPPFDAERPFLQDLDLEWYCRREGPGLIIGIGNSPSDPGDTMIDRSLLPEVVERILHRAPTMAEARITNGWVGLRSLTPDDDPIVGEAATIGGLFNCCGWGGHGVMHAPAGGLLTAELITDGRATSADVAGFRLERFAHRLTPHDNVSIL